MYIFKASVTVTYVTLVEDNPAMASPRRKLPVLHIDFSKTPTGNIGTIYPLSDASMSNALGEGWTAEEVRRINTQHGLYTDIPLMCIGKTACAEGDETCPYALYCPIPDEIVSERYIYKGCPVEILEAFKLFAGYVLDLEIQPGDFTDIQIVVDLVRLHLQLRRCDLYQRNKPIYDLKSGAVVQKTGEVKKDKIENLGFSMQQKIRSDISKKYEQLVASRKEKVKAEAAIGKDKTDSATVYSRLREIGVDLGIIDSDDEPSLPALLDQNSVEDAEVTSYDDDED